MILLAIHNTETEARPGTPTMLVTITKPATEKCGEYGLKYYTIRFRYRDTVKSLRLIGWSEASVLKEFSERFPEAQPEQIEYEGEI